MPYVTVCTTATNFTDPWTPVEIEVDSTRLEEFQQLLDSPTATEDIAKAFEEGWIRKLS